MGPQCTLAARRMQPIVRCQWLGQTLCMGVVNMTRARDRALKINVRVGRKSREPWGTGPQ